MSNAAPQTKSVPVKHPMQFEISGQTLVLEKELGLLVLFSQGQPVHMSLFSPQEAELLFILLDNHPHHCPTEVLLASVSGGKATEQEIDRARERLNNAQDEGNWSNVTQPVRNALSRVRLKLLAFRFYQDKQEYRLNIYTIILIGCQLKAEPVPRKKRAT